MRIRKRWIFICLLILIFVALWLLYGTSNLNNYKTIGDIPTPAGYERISGEDPAYTQFLRSLPLKKRGSKAKLFTGEDANYQIAYYAIVDLPMLSNWEQCADVCMRLRSEYLFEARKYGGIHFTDFHGKTQRYGGGCSRSAFESYLKKTYCASNTCTMRNEMKVRPLKDIQPGDIFVFQASGDRKVGHAEMVVDVAINKDGKKAFLMAEGNTPAREITVLRNFWNPFRSPWFILDEDDSEMRLPFHRFCPQDLRHF